MKNKKVFLFLLCFLFPLSKGWADSTLLNSLPILDLYKKIEKINNDYKELQQKYEEAKAREQSLANRTLTAASIAATGLGAMELARGLSEQKADKAAEQDMDAYIQTMRCTYGNGTQVKAGPERIELPGGNNPELMKLRAEYFALAASLKERKAALGLPPGIESEVILDKSQIGLYDDENVGITGGSYESLYRAKALGSESDQQKISEQQSASKKRVVGGAIATGVGVVGSMVGNAIINGKNDKPNDTEKKDDKDKNKCEKDASEAVETAYDKHMSDLKKDLETCVSFEENKKDECKKNGIETIQLAEHTSRFQNDLENIVSLTQYKDCMTDEFKEKLKNYEEKFDTDAKNKIEESYNKSHILIDAEEIKVEPLVASAVKVDTTNLQQIIPIQKKNSTNLVTNTANACDSSQVCKENLYKLHQKYTTDLEKFGCIKVIKKYKENDILCENQNRQQKHFNYSDDEFIKTAKQYNCCPEVFNNALEDFKVHRDSILTRLFSDNVYMKASQTKK